MSGTTYLSRTLPCPLISHQRYYVEKQVRRAELRRVEAPLLVELHLAPRSSHDARHYHERANSIERVGPCLEHHEPRGGVYE